MKRTRKKNIRNKRKTHRKKNKGGNNPTIIMGDQNSLDSSLDSSLNSSSISSSLSTIDSNISDLSDLSLKSLDRISLNNQNKTPIIDSIKKIHKAIDLNKSDKELTKNMNTLVKQVKTFNKSGNDNINESIRVQNNLSHTLENKYNSALESEFWKHYQTLEKVNKKIQGIDIKGFNSTFIKILNASLFNYFNVMQRKYKILSGSSRYYDKILHDDDAILITDSKILVDNTEITTTEFNERMLYFKDKITIDNNNNYISEKDEHGKILFDYLLIILRKRYNFNLIEVLDEEKNFNRLKSALFGYNERIEKQIDFRPNLINKYDIIMKKKIKQYKDLLNKKLPKKDTRRYKSIKKKLEDKIKNYETVIEKLNNAIETIKRFEPLELENVAGIDDNAGIDAFAAIRDRNGFFKDGMEDHIIHLKLNTYKYSRWFSWSDNDEFRTKFPQFVDSLFFDKKFGDFLPYRAQRDIDLHKINYMDHDWLLLNIGFIVRMAERLLKETIHKYFKFLEHKYKLFDLVKLDEFDMDILSSDIKKNIVSYLGEESNYYMTNTTPKNNSKEIIKKSLNKLV